MIDEDGNLFGAVNLIDALAVLLILAVVMAGVAFLIPSEPQGQEQTRYATIDLGDHPPFIANQVSSGDVMTAKNNLNNLTIADVYVTPAGDGNLSLIVLAEIEGKLVRSEDSPGTEFQFSERVIRPGNGITLATSEYDMNGRIVAVKNDSEPLNVENTKVIITGSVPASAARNIEAGDTLTVDGRTLAEVTSVYVGPNNESEKKRIVVGLQLNTILRTDQPWFGGRPLRFSRSISLDFDEYRLSGTVSKLDSDQVNIEKSVVTLQTTVDLSTANRLESGISYEIAGESVATIEAVTLYPTADANRKRAVIEVTLRTVREESGPVFGTFPIQIGASIPIETDAVSVSGTVIERGSLSESGTTETVRTVVRVDNVQPEIADGVTVGMEEQSGGTIFARVTDKRVEPAIVVLTSEDGNIFQREHPRNKDVFLTLELQVRSTSTGMMFHGTRLQHGDEIVLDFGSITIQATVTEFGGT